MTTEPAPQPQACTGCGGTGGTTVDTSGGGVHRESWQTCRSCGGTGRQHG